jgi:hypothetical protein
MRAKGFVVMKKKSGERQSLCNTILLNNDVTMVNDLPVRPKKSTAARLICAPALKKNVSVTFFMHIKPGNDIRTPVKRSSIFNDLRIYR